jgi:tRNA nucleotidyltransferase (CCA-adding enzyme)
MEALLRKIAREIEAEGGVAYFTGGWVRDHLRGQASQDYDVEVHGLSLERLESLLSAHGRCEAVGRSFGVLKLFTDEGWADFSLPRRESKVGAGHRGFLVDLDPSITPREACARRDFTVNAMMIRVIGGELLDFFGGQEDLEAGILRHVGPAFVEDPLRVYRLMRFAGVLEMEPAPDTLEICRGMELGDLAPERVYAEFERLLLEARRPSLGLEAARRAGILDYHPELEAMVG